MVINDVPEITTEIRMTLSDIFNDRFNEIQYNVNDMLTYPEAEYAHDFDYHQVFQQDKNNMVYYHDKKRMMSVFNFSQRNHIRIWKLLGLQEHRPLLNGIRVFAGNTVPMHVDANRGNIGRENLIYTIVVNGKDGMLLLSNEKNGSKRVMVPGLSQFVMYPTLMEHGAIAGGENYDLLQIQL